MTKLSKSALYDLLEAADNVDGDVYAPSTLTGEAYLEIEQKIRLVKREIESLIGKKLIEVDVQDLSYMRELNIYREGVGMPGHSGPWQEVEFGIDFSNFFNFVVIKEHYNDESMSYPIEKVIEILETYSFIYIPNDVIMSEYNGKYKDLLQNNTWWDRFFGWF